MRACFSFGVRVAARRSLDSYTRIGARPTDAARPRRYSRPMTEKHIFADVDLPFHVWVKESGRWVLRDAAEQGIAAGVSRAEPASSLPPDSARRP
jgi:hypothetical protein